MIRVYINMLSAISVENEKLSDYLKYLKLNLEKYNGNLYSNIGMYI